MENSLQLSSVFRRFGYSARVCKKRESPVFLFGIPDKPHKKQLQSGPKRKRQGQPTFLYTSLARIICTDGCTVLIYDIPL